MLVAINQIFLNSQGGGVCAIISEKQRPTLRRYRRCVLPLIKPYVRISHIQLFIKCFSDCHVSLLHCLKKNLAQYNLSYFSCQLLLIFPSSSAVCHNNGHSQQRQTWFRGTPFAKYWALCVEQRHGKRVTHGNERMHRRQAQNICTGSTAPRYTASSSEDGTRKEQTSTNSQNGRSSSSKTA